MTPRRTVFHAIEVSGRGLFTGRPATMRIVPAAAGSGIVFVRTDLPGSPRASATLASLASAPPGIPARNTTLRVGAAEVLTVEHVLSALTGLGVSDVEVHISGPEVPIDDGSAAVFAESIWKAGIRYLGEDAAPLTISREVTVMGAGGAAITARPRRAPGCSYEYILDYGAGGPIPAQRAAFDAATVHTPSPPVLHNYLRDVAPARTFCTLAEAKAMQAAGLFKDLSPKDLLVIGENGPVENAYRFENEPSRHKLLDLIGDLALVGRPLQVDISASRTGHALNHAMGKALMEAAD